MPKSIRAVDASQSRITDKCVLAILPEADVHMATGAGVLVRIFRHERDADTLLVGNLFEALFIDRVVIRHVEDVRVLDIEFVLAFPPFPLGAFDRHT